MGLRKGEVVGASYRVLDLIGRGWAGAVYRADSVDSEIVVPGTYAKPQVNNVTT